MKKFCLFIVNVLLIGVLCGNVFASSSHSNSLVNSCTKLLEQKMPKLKIFKIMKGPLPGSCEVWSGSNVLYVYPKQAYLIFGNIYNLETAQSLTMISRNKLFEERIKSIPLKDAIKIGKGTKKVIMFTDPDCPYCRRTEKYILEEFASYLRDNYNKEFFNEYSLYVFLFPLKRIHPTAEQHSLEVLCSNKPVEQLLSYIDNRASQGSQYKTESQTKNLLANCNIQEAKEKLVKMENIGKDLGINGVPFIIIDKTIINGANLEKIKSALLSQIDKNNGRKIISKR